MAKKRKSTKRIGAIGIFGTALGADVKHGPKKTGGSRMPKMILRSRRRRTGQ